MWGTTCFAITSFPTVIKSGILPPPIFSALPPHWLMIYVSLCATVSVCQRNIYTMQTSRVSRLIRQIHFCMIIFIICELYLAIYKNFQLYLNEIMQISLDHRTYVTLSSWNRVLMRSWIQRLNQYNNFSPGDPYSTWKQNICPFDNFTSKNNSQFCHNEELLYIIYIGIHPGY